MLAAGSGTRFGRPKALVDTGSGPWVLTTLDLMRGCDELVVVLGAQADQVAELLPETASRIVNPDHAAGIGSSLVVGLRALSEPGADAALVMLVDLPDVTAAVVDRLAAYVRSLSGPAGILARAAYRGQPGHPVLIGRDHFAGVIAGSVADSGARNYLAERDVRLIECGDLGDGRDVDTPNQL